MIAPRLGLTVKTALLSQAFPAFEDPECQAMPCFRELRFITILLFLLPIKQESISQILSANYSTHMEQPGPAWQAQVCVSKLTELSVNCLFSGGQAI